MSAKPKRADARAASRIQHSVQSAQPPHGSKFDRNAYQADLMRKRRAADRKEADTLGITVAELHDRRRAARRKGT